MLRVSSSIPCECNFLTANKAFQPHKFILYVTENFKLFYSATPQKIIFPRPGFEPGPGQCSLPATGVKKGETTLSEIKTVQVLILN